MTSQDKKHSRSPELTSQYGKSGTYTIQQLSTKDQAGLYKMIKGTLNQLEEKING